MPIKNRYRGGLLVFATLLTGMLIQPAMAFADYTETIVTIPGAISGTVSFDLYLPDEIDVTTKKVSTGVAYFTLNGGDKTTYTFYTGYAGNNGGNVTLTANTQYMAKLSANSSGGGTLIVSEANGGTISSGNIDSQHDTWYYSEEHTGGGDCNTTISYIKTPGDTTIHVGDPFDPMQGVTARGANCDDLTSSVTIDGKVNNMIPGTYKLTYSIKDLNGDIAIGPEYRTITVINDATTIACAPQTGDPAASIWQATTILSAFTCIGLAGITMRMRRKTRRQI